MLNIGCNGQKGVQEKESIISVRYGQTNHCLASLGSHSAEPRDVKAVTLGTDCLTLMSDSYIIHVLSHVMVQRLLLIPSGIFPRSRNTASLYHT